MSVKFLKSLKQIQHSRKHLRRSALHQLCFSVLTQCRIQQFFWGAGFSTGVARRKTVVQLVSLGRRCKLSSLGSRGKAPENFGYFDSELLKTAQNSSKQKEHIVGLVHERSFVYF